LVWFLRYGKILVSQNNAMPTEIGCLLQFTLSELFQNIWHEKIRIMILQGCNIVFIFSAADYETEQQNFIVFMQQMHVCNVHNLQRAPLSFDMQQQHSFNSPISGTTQVSQYTHTHILQPFWIFSRTPEWAGTRKVKPIWINRSNW